MTRLVLPGMKQRRRGYIVNLSSGSGVIPSCPLLSIYAATKAYVDCFSRAVDGEYARYGVRVQSQTPFFIATKLAKIRRTSLQVPSAQAYVASGMRWIGQAPSCSPYFMHDFLMQVLHMLPYPMAVANVCGSGVGGSVCVVASSIGGQCPRGSVHVCTSPTHQVFNSHERLRKAYYRKIAAQQGNKKES